ncbi:reverse transcriptase domain-containing protein, partial [Tanacetum coccineum]
MTKSAILWQMDHEEVHYQYWLSNPVMVKKNDNSWIMRVDFKDLNKACPKDGYPLPEIDWKVESLCGFPFKCFLDAYKGYHQIQMEKEDEEKTAFIINQEKEELVIYLAASKEAVSAVLMTEREAKQMSIYFVSRALRGPEVNYTSMEKLVLALVHASKRLRRLRISVKGQVLADFIVERPEEEDPDDSA